MTLHRLQKHSPKRDRSPNLGEHLGSSQPAHIDRWVSAQLAGQRSAPKCIAISKRTGERCRTHVRPGGCPYCVRHRRGKFAIAADLDLAERNLYKLAASNHKITRERAERSLRRIARHEVYRTWKIDPRAPVIDLLQLSSEDEAHVEEWLWSHHGVRLDQPLPGSEHPPTARCRDKLRYAAWRIISRGAEASPQMQINADRRVITALASDAKFWAKLAAADAEAI